jgi:hypothetical protein
VCGIIFDFLVDLLGECSCDVGFVSHQSHLVEEHTKKTSRPILHAFFGELMIGGFLSLLSFILVFSDALTGLSVKVFGEEGEKFAE